MFGPPFPGAPWSAAGPAGGAPAPAATPAPPAGRGIVKPFVPRDPNQGNRTRRSLDITSQILNSLMRQGIVVQSNPTVRDEWTIDLDALAESGLTGEYEDSFGSEA